MDTLKRAFTFWDKLSEEEQTYLTNNTFLVTYKKGENIHSGDDDCIGVLVVKSGELRVYMLSDDGKEVTLFRLKSGDVCMLSASCLLKNVTFDVFIDSETESEVYLINSAAFSEIVNNNMYVENFTLKVIIDKFSDVMWAMEQILFISFDKRLATFLIDEAVTNEVDTINLTHEQIAKYVGSAREVVSRMLKYFEKEKLVELSRGGIKIIDKEKLRKKAI